MVTLTFGYFILQLRRNRHVFSTFYHDVKVVFLSYTTEVVKRGPSNVEAAGVNDQSGHAFSPSQTSAFVEDDDDELIHENSRFLIHPI